MFHEILKYGSYIVDALNAYNRPIFVYIPPHGELRGGAWVVVDTQINPRQMEMYMDPLSRGGILEPSGTVEIKYRKKDLIQTIHRLDAEAAQLVAELAAAASSAMSPEEVQRKRLLLEAREEALLPAYQQIATAFADLHDTAGRAKAKGVIEEIVPWEQSRTFFYHRLQYRLALDQIVRRAVTAAPLLPLEEVDAMVSDWIPPLPSTPARTQWILSHTRELDNHIRDLAADNFAQAFATGLTQDIRSATNAFAAAIQGLPSKDKETAMRVLKEALDL